MKICFSCWTKSRTRWCSWQNSGDDVSAIAYEVFAEIRRGEGRRKVMLNDKSVSATEVSALVSKNTSRFPSNQQLWQATKERESGANTVANLTIQRKFVGICMVNHQTGSQNFPSQRVVRQEQTNMEPRMKLQPPSTFQEGTARPTV